MGAGEMLFGQSGHGVIVAKISFAYTEVDSPKTAHRVVATEERIVTVDGIKCDNIQIIMQKRVWVSRRQKIRSKND